MLAVVGRPNVGKSTLVNRILGRREAVVEDVPGVTRDRVSYDADWNGRAFTVVDTGGWDPDARGLAEQIVAQAEIAVGLADAVLFVVDAAVGITDADEAVVRILRRVRQAGGPGGQQGRRPARRGRGRRRCGTSGWASRTRSRRCTAAGRATCSTPSWPRCPSRAGAGLRRARRPAPGRDRRQAQRRQVLAAQQAGRRGAGSVVDDVAGTTVDPVDELVELGGRTWRFIDTAGIRKRVKEAAGTSTTPRCAPRPRSSAAEVAVVRHRRRRSRSPSRTCGSSRPSARPAARW